MDQALGAFIGTDRTMSDLSQAAAALQAAYREAGYGAVVVYVPEQSIEGGRVTLTVLEGKVATVEAAGSRFHDTANVRASLPSLREGVTPPVATIDAELQMANENPAKEMTVTLEPGTQPGDVVAKVDVEERNPLRFLLNFDNTGNDHTGNYRLGIGVQHANLWNLDHMGTAQYQTSPGNPDLVRIFALGYRIPFYRQLTVLDLFAAHSDVDSATVATVAGPLQFNGKGDIVGFRLTRHLPRIGEYDQRVVLGWDQRDYRNQCALGVFGSAACGTADASVTVRPIMLGYAGQTAGTTPWGVSLSVAQNVFLGGPNGSRSNFEATRPGADPHYLVGRGSSFIGTTLPLDWQVRGRLSGQYSPNALVPGEQLGLGGAGTVRGYEEREQIGDYGYIANLEAYTPDIAGHTGVAGLKLRFLAFYDVGRVANHRGAPCSANDTGCQLAGAGLGLRLGFGDTFEGKLDVAQAFKAGSQTDRGDVRGHIAISFSY